MSNYNDITGDKLQTRPSKTYADNFDGIFRKSKEIIIEDKLIKKDNKNVKQPKSST